MASATISDLQHFHRYVGEQLNNGGHILTPEECVQHWRAEQLERAEANKGIQNGLEDMKAGRGQPLAEFLSEFRDKNGIKNP